MSNPTKRKRSETLLAGSRAFTLREPKPFRTPSGDVLERFPFGLTTTPSDHVSTEVSRPKKGGFTSPPERRPGLSIKENTTGRRGSPWVAKTPRRLHHSPTRWCSEPSPTARGSGSPPGAARRETRLDRLDIGMRTMRMVDEDDV